MSKLTIKFNPQGFAECLNEFSGEVQAAADQIAANATAHLTNGGGFHVEMSTEARYRDSAYGATRPVAYVVPDDKESDAEEAENKILSLALWGG